MAKAEKMNRRKKVEEVKKDAMLATSQEMIVKTLDNGEMVAQDEQGMYLTRSHFVGTGLLDPYRSWDHRRQEYVEEEVAN